MYRWKHKTWNISRGTFPVICRFLIYQFGRKKDAYNANITFLYENRRYIWFHANFSENTMVKLFNVLNLTPDFLLFKCFWRNIFFLFLSRRLKKNEFGNFRRKWYSLFHKKHAFIFLIGIVIKEDRKGAGVNQRSSLISIHHCGCKMAGWGIGFCFSQICNAHLRSNQRSIQVLNELEQSIGERNPKKLPDSTVTREV